MKKLLEFFQEDNGNLSSMRLYCFIALIVAAILSFKGGSFELILMWIVATFAPKSIQKFSEAKKPAV